MNFLFIGKIVIIASKNPMKINDITFLSKSKEANANKFIFLKVIFLNLILFLLSFIGFFSVSLGAYL